VPAPRARNIAYNAVGPISALGFRSPTLAQLMARFATTDPSLSSLAANRRQGLSLIAPPNAKRRRTIKKVLVVSYKNLREKLDLMVLQASIAPLASHVSNHAKKLAHVTV
jgi:hypothetical protein